jgi:hypothetical protein
MGKSCPLYMILYPMAGNVEIGPGDIVTGRKTARRYHSPDRRHARSAAAIS